MLLLIILLPFTAAFSFSWQHNLDMPCRTRDVYECEPIQNYVQYDEMFRDLNNCSQANFPVANLLRQEETALYSPDFYVEYQVTDTHHTPLRINCLYTPLCNAIMYDLCLDDEPVSMYFLMFLSLSEVNTILLAPGATVAKTGTLSSTFRMTEPGLYSISVVGEIYLDTGSKIETKISIKEAASDVKDDSALQFSTDSSVELIEHVPTPNTVFVRLLNSKKYEQFDL